VEPLAGIENDVDHNQTHEERDLDAADNVLDATVLPNWKEVDEEEHNEEQTDPDTRVGSHSRRPLYRLFGVTDLSKVFRVDTELEDLGDGTNFGGYDANPREPS
jgi:hypothetical protein